MVCPLRLEFKGSVEIFFKGRQIRGIRSWYLRCIIFPMAAIAGSPTLLCRREPGWIYKPSWDLPVLIFSAVLVPLPFLIAWLAQISGWMRPQQAIDVIN